MLSHRDSLPDDARSACADKYDRSSSSVVVHPRELPAAEPLGDRPMGRARHAAARRASTPCLVPLRGISRMDRSRSRRQVGPEVGSADQPCRHPSDLQRAGRGLRPPTSSGSPMSELQLRFSSELTALSLV